MSKTIYVGVPGQAARLQDVVSVASGAQVDIDEIAAQRIKKESPAPSAFIPEDSPPDLPSCSSNLDNPDIQESRAAAFAIILAVVNGKSRVRLQVVEQLLRMLNDQSREGLAGDLGSIAFSLIQELSISSEDEHLSVSKEERDFLGMNHLPAAGVGALAVMASRQLQRTSLALTALACEALQADVRDLEADKVEALCPPSTSAVAAGLRDMLNESSRINARKGGSGALQCLLQIPAALGGLEDLLSRLEPSVQSLLTASITDPALMDRLKPFQGMAQGLSQLSAALSSIRTLVNEQADTIGACSEVEDANGNREYMKLLISERRASAQASMLNGSQKSGTALEEAQKALEAAHQLSRALAAQAWCSLQSLEAQGVTAHEPAAEGKAASKNRKKGKNAGSSLGIGTSRLRLLLQEDLSDHNPTVGSQLSALQNRLNPFSEQLDRELDLLQQLIQSNAKLRKPKVAKGARDFMPEQMAIRQQAFATISAAFELHGAVSIDTPVFELKDTLTGKYGEDSKLIYDLKDQGGELLSLRYDLTVPFARFVALNGITNIKRYHIAKVYRRDQPQAARGRYREFYQCDFDVAGSSPLMVADSEVLKVLTEILVKLDLGHFTVKINHRVLLDGMMNLCGVPAGKFRTICSAIDKLDKEPWETVRTEMVEDKGLDPKVADQIGTFVGNKGEPLGLLAKLTSPEHEFAEDENCCKALAELKVLFELLDMMGALHHFSFDLSLARGLDYYTGVIYEAVLEGANVGSIAAGGRYDNLVGMFSGKQVPAVGVSLGIERIFSILEAKHRQEAAASGGKIRETKTQVLVMSASKDMQAERIRLASELWSQGVAAEFGYKANPFMPEQMSYASSSGIPICIVLRPDELKQGTVELMETVSGTKEILSRDSVVRYIQSRLKELGTVGLVVVGKPESSTS